MKNFIFCPRSALMCFFFGGSQNKQRLFPFTALTDLIFGAFAKLRKATISFLMSVSLSVRLSVRMEHLVSHWADFHEI